MHRSSYASAWASRAHRVFLFAQSALGADADKGSHISRRFKVTPEDVARAVVQLGPRALHVLESLRPAKQRSVLAKLNVLVRTGMGCIEVIIKMAFSCLVSC